MTKTSAFLALLLLPGALACGGGDPAQGSSGRPYTPVSSTGNPSSDAGSTAAGGADAGAGATGNADDDAGAIADGAPPFENPAPGDGACVTPNLVCGGDGGSDAGPVCVAVTTDVDNCGACGNQCLGPSATCIGGQCACSQLGLLYCSSAAGCIDTTSDVNNCGACGNVCDPNQFNACAGSLCVSQ